MAVLKQRMMHNNSQVSSAGRDGERVQGMTCSGSQDEAAETFQKQSVRTMAEVVDTAVKSGNLQSTAVHKTAKKVVYGQAVNRRLQKAKVLKPIHLFISRLSPDTNCDSMSDYVSEMMTEALGSTIPRDRVTCEKLRTRFDTYASFCITVVADETMKDAVIKLLMSSDAWPEGVLVRRFYHQRNG